MGNQQARLTRRIKRRFDQADGMDTSDGEERNWTVDEDLQRSRLHHQKVGQQASVTDDSCESRNSTSPSRGNKSWKNSVSSPSRTDDERVSNTVGWDDEGYCDTTRIHQDIDMLFSYLDGWTDDPDDLLAESRCTTTTKTSLFSGMSTLEETEEDDQVEEETGSPVTNTLAPDSDSHDITPQRLPVDQSQITKPLCLAPKKPHRLKIPPPPPPPPPPSQKPLLTDHMLKKKVDKLEAPGRNFKNPTSSDPGTDSTNQAEYNCFAKDDGRKCSSDDLPSLKRVRRAGALQAERRSICSPVPVTDNSGSGRKYPDDRRRSLQLQERMSTAAASQEDSRTVVPDLIMIANQPTVTGNGKTSQIEGASVTRRVVQHFSTNHDPKVPVKLHEGDIVMAMYSCTNAMPGTVSFVKGQSGVVMRLNVGGWCYVSLRDSEGWASTRYWKSIRSATGILSKGRSDRDEGSWMWRCLSRPDCSFLLQRFGQDGDYIVRNSSTREGEYTLSVRLEDDIHSFAIKGNDYGKFTIGNLTFQFNGLADIVAHYQHHTILPETFAVLQYPFSIRFV